MFTKFVFTQMSKPVQIKCLMLEILGRDRWTICFSVVFILLMSHKQYFKTRAFILLLQNLQSDIVKDYPIQSSHFTYEYFEPEISYMTNEYNLEYDYLPLISAIYVPAVCSFPNHLTSLILLPYLQGENNIYLADTFIF